MTLDQRLADLDERLRGLGSVVVAFSGGADSAFLLAAAVRALGADAVVAATAVSPSLPASELEAAATFARGLGVRHLTPATDEMSRSGYAANGPDRCFHCKAELLDVLVPTAAGSASTTWPPAPTPTTPATASARASGQRRWRAPSHRCATPGSPRPRCARRRAPGGWSTADKPAAACLCSRVAYGIQISPARLGRIERAEAALRAAMVAAGLPVRDLRVRDHGDRARVEVDRDARRGARATARPARGGHRVRRSRGRPTRLPVRVDERGAEQGEDGA